MIVLNNFIISLFAFYSYSTFTNSICNINYTYFSSNLLINIIKMNKNVLIAIILLLLIGGGAYFIMNRNSTGNSESLLEDSQDTTTTQQEDTTMQKEEVAETNDEQTAENEGAVKEFTVISKPFLFNQKELRVKKGDTVKITLDNQEGTHDFTLDEFNVKTKTLNAGQEETVEFVADKAGTFEFYCSIGNHRAMGMVGNLIVE